MPETKSNSKQNSSSTPVKKGKLSSKSAFSVKKNQKNDHLTTKAPSKKAPTHRINPVEQSEKKVPLWLVFIFLFSLVFFLFALYKAFIFKKGYNLPFGEEPLTGQTTVQQPDFLFQEDQQQES